MFVIQALISVVLAANLIGCNEKSAIYSVTATIFQNRIAPYLCPTSLLLLGLTSQHFFFMCQNAFELLYAKNKGIPKIINVEALYDIYNGMGSVDPDNMAYLEKLILKYIPSPPDRKYEQVFKAYKKALFDDDAKLGRITVTKRFPELCRMVLKHKDFKKDWTRAGKDFQLLKPYIIDVGLSYFMRSSLRMPTYYDIRRLKPESAIILYDFLQEAKTDSKKL